MSTTEFFRLVSNVVYFCGDYPLPCGELPLHIAQVPAELRHAKYLAVANLIDDEKFRAAGWFFQEQYRSGASRWTNDPLIAFIIPR